MRTLSKENTALLELTRLALSGKSDFDFSLLTDDMWQSVFDESRMQAVSLLCLDAVKKTGVKIPDDIYSKWFNYSVKLLRTNLTVINNQKALEDLLCKNNIPYIIIKGSSSAAYYPDSEKRSFGDIDFLVSPDDYDTADKVLLADGYVKRIDEHLCHRVYTKGSAHIEMHFEPAGIPDGEPGRLVREFLRDATTRFEMKGTPPFRAPVPELHGVIILIHNLHHMLGEGLGIRLLCDWGCFVDKTYTEPFWADTLLPLIKKLGLTRFTAAMTRTCSYFFGTACPEWARDIPDSLCVDVISDILTLGNLGSKDRELAFSGNLVSNHGKAGTGNNTLVNMAHTLRDTMYSTHPILRKCILLYPFVFVWRVIKYLCLMAVGKKPSLIKMNTYAAKRREVYNQFKLFEKEEK